MMTFGELAMYVRQRLRELSISLPKTSRIETMLRTAESVTRTDDLRGFLISRQTFKDLQELDFILRHLFAGEVSGRLLATLRTALKDPVLPSRTAHSPGRNAQAELHAGAVLVKAGVRPIKCDPPDYRFEFDGTSWAIEVKRLQSERKLEQRVHDGFEALATANAVGLLWVDTSQAIKTSPTRLVAALPENAIGKLWGHRLKRIIDEMCPPNWLRTVRRGREIRGLVFIDHFVIPNGCGEWCHHTLTFGVAIDDNLRRRKQFDRIFEVIRSGTPTPEIRTTDPMRA